MSDVYDFYRLTNEEKKELLGTDVGGRESLYVVELDEYSQRFFYNEQFAPLNIKTVTLPEGNQLFIVMLYSIDDSMLRMEWKVSKMELLPYVVKDKILEYLKRTNFFISLKGFEYYCKIFGEAVVEYN